MCWKCANNLSQEQMVKKLESILESPIKSFDNFNTSSVWTILYCNIGLFGQTCREKSFDIMDQFIDYLHTKKSMYLPDSGLESMYHPELIIKIYWYAKNYDTDYSKLDDQEYKVDVLNYLGDKFNEYDKELEKNLFYRLNKYLSKPYLISKEEQEYYQNSYKIGFILGIGVAFYLYSTQILVK